MQPLWDVLAGPPVLLHNVCNLTGQIFFNVVCPSYLSLLVLKTWAQYCAGTLVIQGVTLAVSPCKVALASLLALATVTFLASPWGLFAFKISYLFICYHNVFGLYWDAISNFEII
jgi:hypothetical protein